MNTMTHSDCIAYLRTLPDASVDSCVTDPPYELGFMGKKWDSSGIAYSVELWREVLRVLKPGAHLLAFGGTRTHHRMVCAIEDAGFEIRDEMQWLYGSGFPKSMNVAKAIQAKETLGSCSMTDQRQAAMGDEYTPSETVGHTRSGTERAMNCKRSSPPPITAPATDAAKQWDGFGTSLKPAQEPVTWATKPLTPLDYCAKMIANLNERIESCRQNASNAGASSALIQAASRGAMTSIVPENAATPTGEARKSEMETGQAEDISSEADTSESTSAAASIVLNTLLSWRRILADLCDVMKTSTTSTEFETITDWRTLSFCLSQITPADIIPDAFRPNGLSANAGCAESYFNGELMRLQITRELSAVAPALRRAAQSCREETGLTPDASPICVARKPLDGTVAANVLKHGTGAINVDGCRVGTETVKSTHHKGDLLRAGKGMESQHSPTYAEHQGRWPANVILSHAEGCVCTGTKRVKGSNGTAGGKVEHAAFGGGMKNRGNECGYADADGLETVEAWQCVEGCPVRLLDAQSGESKSTTGVRDPNGTMGYHGGASGLPGIVSGHGDTGGASRFFYTAKASRSEREHFNTHATVKPLALMRYLVRLVTPPGGVVLDMFAGSGTTLVAARQEGFRFLGCDADEGHVRIAQDRLALELPFET